MIDRQSVAILTRVETSVKAWHECSFTQNLRIIAESYLSLIDNFPQFPLPMNYVSNCTNLTVISRLKTRCHKSFRVFLFENWNFLSCCYLIIRYLNQFPRCGNRSFPNCIIFRNSRFCLYLRKLANFVTHTQKNILVKF